VLTLFGGVLMPLRNEVIQYPADDEGPNLGEIALTQFVDPGVLHVCLDDLED
jgi:hypothetical protein